jgi:glutathione S-transferase
MPPTAFGRWQVRAFIDKNTPLADSWFPLIQAFTADAKATLNAKTLELVKTFNSSLIGPYAVGEQFTLADIAFISIFERLITVAGHYSGFTIPTSEEYKKFHACMSPFRYSSNTFTFHLSNHRSILLIE